jgi:4-hydroxy-tetrahydrodipicolinate synthase
MAQMVNAAMSDNWVVARRINRHYFQLMQANFSEPSPAPIKAVMALLGRGNEELRLPMVPVTSTTRRKLERILGELGLLTNSPHENLRVF